MNEIALLDAVTLTGKNESTLRRYFNKPENKAYRVIRAGKLFLDKDFLLQRYPAILAPKTPGQMPELHEETPELGIKMPKENARIPEFSAMVEELKKDKAFLQNQIDELRKESVAERAQYQDRQRESNIIIQSLQEKVAKQLPASDQEPIIEERKQVVSSMKRWRITAIVALCLCIVCTGLLVIALINGWRFIK